LTPASWEVFRKATVYSPERSQAWQGLGLSLWRQEKNLAEAAVALTRAAEIDPQRKHIQCSLGELRLALDQPAEALPPLERCAALQPGSGDAQAWLGWGLERSGAGPAAIAAYRRALALEPANRLARDGLARFGERTP
jgi:tetratricopeptide (TPR) repeat protein